MKESDADRQKRLLEDLLLMSDAKHYGPLCRRAFDEIERLAGELEKTRKDRDEWHFKLQHFLVRYAKENQP